MSHVHESVLLNGCFTNPNNNNQWVAHLIIVNPAGFEGVDEYSEFLVPISLDK